MENLHKTNPSVYEELKNNGNFVISRTKNPFSAMGIDHRHEQLNKDIKDIKGSGGMVGLTEDPEKFRRWSVCSPEIARVIKEFEAQSVLNMEHNTDHEFHHHEHSASFQTRFAKHVEDLTSEFVQLGNPFIVQDDCQELIQLGTRDVMGIDAIKAVRNVEATGVKQFEDFLKYRIVDRSISISNTISQNILLVSPHNF